MNFYKLEYLY